MENLVKSVDIGTIRHECLYYTSLEKWRGGQGSFAAENTVITGIAPSLPNILVFPVSNTVNCPYIVYAEKDGEHYIYPLTEKEANAIIA